MQLEWPPAVEKQVPLSRIQGCTKLAVSFGTSVPDDLPVDFVLFPAYTTSGGATKEALLGWRGSLYGNHDPPAGSTLPPRAVSRKVNSSGGNDHERSILALADRADLQCHER
jgi:hypothetical protein